MEAGRTLVDTLNKSNSPVYTDNEILDGLAKLSVLKKLQESDRPLEDATAQMLVMGQGPRAFSYLVPELTAAGRVSNAIRDNNIHRLHGLPSKADLTGSLADSAIRDKQLWRLTGNGLKANGWSEKFNEGSK